MKDMSKTQAYFWALTLAMVVALASGIANHWLLGWSWNVVAGIGIVVSVFWAQGVLRYREWLSWHPIVILTVVLLFLSLRAADHLARQSGESGKQNSSYAAVQK